MITCGITSSIELQNVAQIWQFAPHLHRSGASRGMKD
jgi:hypothetical protein